MYTSDFHHPLNIMSTICPTILALSSLPPFEHQQKETQKLVMTQKLSRQVGKK